MDDKIHPEILFVHNLHALVVVYSDNYLVIAVEFGNDEMLPLPDIVCV